jgi:regulator of sigma E protease
MLGGVTVNFLLAILIYIGMSYYYGDIFLPNKNIKDGLLIENTVANKAGLLTGDKIIAVDGDPIETYSEIHEKVLFGKNITIERDGKQSTVTLPDDFLSQLIDSKEKDFIDLREPFIIVEVSDTSFNKNSGLKKGDIIVGLNGIETKYADQVKSELQKFKGQEVTANVLRDKEEIEIPLKISNDAKLGLSYATSSTSKTLEALGYYKYEIKKYGFFESFPVGIKKARDKVSSYITQFKAIFTPSTGAYKGVGGFKAIYDIFPSFWSWQVFWSITAFLSIMLGVLNLLPIPALDGGHVVFLLYEMVSGRKPGDKFMEYAQMAGFIILIALVLFANGNDIFKAIFN